MIDGFDKSKKYYGEVWFTDKKNENQFCVMSFNDESIWLETNLNAKQRHYKEHQILGLFTGLGYVTFIDCRIQHSSSGITETRIYKPKYTFVSPTHLIDTQTLKVKEFFIINDVIAKWVNHTLWYDHIKDKLTKRVFTDEYEIEKIKLKVTLKHYQNINIKRQSGLHISNRGAVKFELEEPVNILTAIEFYNQFQKVLQLTFGRSEKFRRFSFKCTGCGDDKDLYYNDTHLTKSTSTFIHTDYEKVRGSLKSILTAAYTDDTFKFCLDKLMENFIGKHPSHNKRFINSISAYEAYCKNYLREGKNQLYKRIKENEEVFRKIGDFTDEVWKTFPNKVVRARDYHIHSNLDNKNIYSEFELLYISFLFDYAIAYLLLAELDDIEDLLLNKIIEQGKSTFVSLQRTNVILGSNPLT
tara:strand:- start:9146 stop:10384 length:1239 start_codon:yes stop_codon:yes gene_type:complete